MSLPLEDETFSDHDGISEKLSHENHEDEEDQVKEHLVQHQPPLTSEGLQLKKQIGLVTGVLFIVGSTVGSGIFVSPGGVLRHTGSVALCLIVWVACGILSLCGALSYAELGTMIPKSGGEYVYVLTSMGPLHPFWGALPAFLYTWVNILILRPAGQAGLCLTAGKYLITFLITTFHLCLSEEDTAMLFKFVAILIICFNGFINCYSPTLTIRLQNGFTATKVLGVSIVIGCGIYEMIRGKTEYLSSGFEGSHLSPGEIALAFYSGLWAYDGWNNLGSVAEELTKPSVNLPRSLFIAIPLIILTYLTTNVAYLTVLSPDRIKNSEAVAVEFAEQILGVASFIIPLCVFLSTSGGGLGGVFTNGRVILAAAREGHLPTVLSYIHYQSRSPSAAIIFASTLAVLYTIPSDLDSIINLLGFSNWIFYSLVMVSLLVLRKTQPNIHRPYKVPLIFPILTFITGIYLVLAPIITQPNFGYLWTVVMLFAGLPVYVFVIQRQCSLTCIEWLTKHLQQLLWIVPSKYVASD